MGDLHDFEVNIKKAHRLVTTGPYSFVRHPGYIASCVARIGVSMAMFSKDHWLYQCGLTSMVGVMLSCIWCAEVVLINGIMVPPSTKNLLREFVRGEFGEWTGDERLGQELALSTNADSFAWYCPGTLLVTLAILYYNDMVDNATSLKSGMPPRLQVQQEPLVYRCCEKLVESSRRKKSCGEDQGGK
ncbi:hypothetical protein BDN71DRAFT_1449736 [Pleurotus eryngii]|uniref:Protein-S-isoprenylcysteine O-methyltransferase n=1 Tax=Pleurotus eryngii TaxID=5323 RepID=A0A9P5ZUR5_PLEER|nr:hypothetical protein BDN71DRAFT_1449736 [Pleurotus eryngii]